MDRPYFGAGFVSKCGPVKCGEQMQYFFSLEWTKKGLSKGGAQLGYGGECQSLLSLLTSGKKGGENQKLQIRKKQSRC